jgi:hypothetical protein
VIIFNFSVIARPAESLPLRQPDPDGRVIWNMMAERYMGRVCLVVNEDYSPDLLEHWLKAEKFKPSMYETLDEELPGLIAQKVHRIGAVFGRPSWYVDNNPRVCAETTSLGIPTLMVACPYIMRPEWSQQREVREWDQLVTEMDKQALKSAERTWKDND